MADIVVTVKDRELGFRFNNLTIDKYCRMRGIPFSDFDDDIMNNIAIANNVMFRCAIDVYSRGEVLIDEYEMEELIDEMSQEDYNSILKTLTSGMKSMLERFVGATQSIKKK